MRILSASSELTDCSENTSNTGIWQKNIESAFIHHPVVPKPFPPKQSEATQIKVLHCFNYLTGKIKNGDGSDFVEAQSVTMPWKIKYAVYSKLYLFWEYFRQCNKSNYPMVTADQFSLLFQTIVGTAVKTIIKIKRTELIQVWVITLTVRIMSHLGMFLFKFSSTD